MNKHGAESPLRLAWAKENDEICQVLGKALGYPWYKDDPKNFPGATEENGVCVGEHVAVTIAMEAAATIAKLKDLLHRVKRALPPGGLYSEVLDALHPDAP